MSRGSNSKNVTRRRSANVSRKNVGFAVQTRHDKTDFLRYKFQLRERDVGDCAKSSARARCICIAKGEEGVGGGGGGGGKRNTRTLPRRCNTCSRRAGPRGVSRSTGSPAAVSR